MGGIARSQSPGEGIDGGLSVVGLAPTQPACHDIQSHVRRLNCAMPMCPPLEVAHGVNRLSHHRMRRIHASLTPCRSAAWWIAA